METKHSPLPWGICQNAAGDIDIAADGGAGDMVCDLAACRNAEANSELIVAAVNAHADLLAACLAAVRCLESIERNESALIAAGNPATTSTIAGWKRNLEHARAAIARAAGQAVTP